MTQKALLIKDCDESQLLTKIFPLLSTNPYVLVGPGDDCAVVLAPNEQFVVSTDILIQDQHFKTNWSSGADVGWRAAMQNLSDINAMGAVPSTVVLALGLPGDLEVAWLEDFYAGFGQACATVGAAVVGGDLSASAIITVAVTVHGDLEGRTPILRSGAKPGDIVAHTGELGWAAAGLAALSAGLSRGIDPAIDLAIARFLRPQPQLHLGPEAAKQGATAMMDISDSVLRDCNRLARSSGVLIDLAARRIQHGPVPVAGHLDGATSPSPRSGAGSLETVAQAILNRGGQGTPAGLAQSWRLSGGEDHGLLATFGNQSQVPAGFTVIGQVRANNPGQPTVTIDGVDASNLEQGWDHFR